MLLDQANDFEKVSLFFTNISSFYHVRTDYMKRMIVKEQLIYEDC